MGQASPHSSRQCWRGASTPRGEAENLQAHALLPHPFPMCCSLSVLLWPQVWLASVSSAVRPYSHKLAAEHNTDYLTVLCNYCFPIEKDKEKPSLKRNFLVDWWVDRSMYFFIPLFKEPPSLDAKGRGRSETTRQGIDTDARNGKWKVQEVVQPGTGVLPVVLCPHLSQPSGLGGWSPTCMSYLLGLLDKF